MLISSVLSIAIAIYCFASGMVLAGVLCLFGVIPGYGMLPLLFAALILFVNGIYFAALVPLLVIANNLRLLFRSAGDGGG